MADKTITYYDVVQEILKRVNDADGDIYLDRAKELVYEGISSLAVSEGVSRDDIRGILKSEVIDVTNITPRWKLQIKGSGSLLSGGRVLDNNPAKIISITDDLTVADEVIIGGITEHRYIELSLEEVNRLNDPDYSPFNDEIFYYQRGDYIYFYPQERMITQKLVITYIAEPDSYSYGTGSPALERDFSLNFLYKTIDYGVGRIREQQSGE
tara:strand:+ start:239 stop:871 length:633 start_codon:yes stop_codon:yes gene_type:complete